MRGEKTTDNAARFPENAPQRRLKRTFFLPGGGEQLMAKPQLYCVQCNRPISHRGRCLACNSQTKTRREAQEKRLEEIKV